MKGLIAAGGRGTRLRPITNTINKHLIPLANKPMIFYAIEKLIAAGITDIGIVINPGDTELPAAISNRNFNGAKFVFIEQIGGPLGVAHVVKLAGDFLKDESFVFYLGDNIIFQDIGPLIEKFEKEKLNSLLSLAKVKDPQRFGVPEIQNGRIIRVVEKPLAPVSDYAVAGIYVYDKNIFEAINSLKPSGRGEFEISEAHTYLIEHGFDVGYQEITGWWKDAGKPEDLLEGNQLILKGMKSNISSTAKIDSSVIIQGEVQIGDNVEISGRTLIRGPVIIGKNSIIRDAYIGPFTSIGNGVKIDGAEIEHSIVFDNVNIQVQTRIVDSLLGLNCFITDAKKTLPPGHRLIIGDHTLVEL